MTSVKAALDQAVAIGRALDPALPSLPLLAELRRLDALLAKEMLAADLVFRDGLPTIEHGGIQVRMTDATAQRLASTIAKMVADSKLPPP